VESPSLWEESVKEEKSPRLQIKIKKSAAGLRVADSDGGSSRDSSGSREGYEGNEAADDGKHTSSGHFLGCAAVQGG
jgi:hypothetical protein